MSTLITELDLARQLALRLTIPIFLVDTQGALTYYNPPAENLLGKKFDETGEMPASIWSRLFIPTDENGIPLLPEALPLVIALNERHPSIGRVYIRGLDNVNHCIDISAFPLIISDGKFVGAVAMFWDVDPKSGTR